MLFSPLLMQLLMGISMRRYCPATGMAGLLRALVSGNNRVPRPPPRIRHNADDVMGEPLSPFETYRLRVGDTLPSRRKDCKQTADRMSLLRRGGTPDRMENGKERGQVHANDANLRKNRQGRDC